MLGLPVKEHLYEVKGSLLEVIIVARVAYKHVYEVNDAPLLLGLRDRIVAGDANR